MGILNDERATPVPPNEADEAPSSADEDPANDAQVVLERRRRFILAALSGVAVVGGNACFEPCLDIGSAGGSYSPPTTGTPASSGMGGMGGGGGTAGDGGAAGAGGQGGTASSSGGAGTAGGGGK